MRLPGFQAHALKLSRIVIASLMIDTSQILRTVVLLLLEANARAGHLQCIAPCHDLGICFLSKAGAWHR